MIRRWLKPCPRCRDNHLIEWRGDDHHAIRCAHCGYTLTENEMKFLIAEMAPVASILRSDELAVSAS